jgi:hypothetical protein
MLLTPNCFYIVDNSSITEPKLLRNQFNSHDGAANAILKYLGSSTDYEVVSYEDCVKYDLKFKTKIGNGVISVRLTKYEYPFDRCYYQGRKSYRTKVRRHRRERAKKRKDDT